MKTTTHGVLREMAQQLSAIADEKSENAHRLSSLDLSILAGRERERALTLRAAAIELLLMVGEKDNSK